MVMRYLWSGAVGIALLLSSTPRAWGDGTTTPGKTAVYVSQSAVTVPNSAAPLVPNVSGTIAKGKKKRVLEIDLTLTDESGSSSVLAVAPNVNGFTDVVQPSPLGGFQL